MTLGRTTPYPVVDLDVLTENVQAMAALAAGRGVALRPHAKTHKCLEIARLQLDAGAVGLTVATVSEAEVFADAGFSDLFIAYPVWAGGSRGPRLAELGERATLRIGVDSVEGAHMLARALPRPAGVGVLVEVDSGHHRTGITPRRADEVALAAVRAGLDVLGVFTFPGHAYGPGCPAPAAAEESEALEQAAECLLGAGIEVRVLSGGSTPTAPYVSEGLNELRPGVYVFGDAQQWELGACQPDQIALTVYATVVSAAADRVVLDAGSKVLGADRPDWASGFGRLVDYPETRVLALAEHHATVAWDRSPVPGPGAVVRVVPNHVCAAVNLADELLVVSGTTEVDRWPVAARGANS